MDFCGIDVNDIRPFEVGIWVLFEVPLEGTFKKMTIIFGILAENRLKYGENGTVDLIFNY